MKEKKEYVNIALKKKDYNGNETNVKIEDLLEYENLKSCNLYRFLVEEKDIEIINKLSNLKFIYFDFCYFSLENLKFNEKIEEINFNLCENLKMKHLANSKAKRIKIIQLKESSVTVDLAEIENMLNVEELYFHNCKVKGIEKILEKAPNIKLINLDGCLVENQNYLMELNEKIKVSYEKEFNYANA
ncbi:MAG: hypothetical protein J6C46_05560 [Clostridia bacterium]|nr:hypothetical protein [Clostridia bacterium]